MASFVYYTPIEQMRKDGSINIKIRVVHKRVSKIIATPWNVTKKDLTPKGVLKNYRYIDRVEQLIQRYKLHLSSLGEAVERYSCQQIVNELSALDNPKSDAPFELDFVKYTRDYIELLKSQGKNTWKCYYTAINSFCEGIGRESVDIADVNAKLINGWLRWLTMRVGENSRAPSLYVQCLKAMHNRAKAEFNDEDDRVVKIALSPFKRVAPTRHVVARKRALSVEQMRAIARLEPSDAQLSGVRRFELARDVFMLSFYLVGMNAVDLFNCIVIEKGRITYERTKTRTRRADRALISIAIPPEAEALVEKYRDPTGERVFDFYRLYSTMNNFNAALNKGLKRVGELVGVEDLQFYAARHSWATVAVNDAGVDKYTVHEALNHVDPSMSVTDIYIRKDWRRIDEANRRVLDLLR